MTMSVTALHGLPTATFLELLNDPAMRVSFSQLGEDLAVLHILATHFRMQRPGFYVDVGAFHPQLYSNTKLLHLMGWRGINIEPAGEAIAAFRLDRPNDINLQLGVAPEPGELSFYEFMNGEVSTFSPETADRWQQLGWVLRRITRVPVRRLDDVLAEHLPPGQTIDYLDIDVEGLDRAIIDGLDLARYRPRMLSIELHGADHLALRDDPTVARLIDHGYALMAFSSVSFLFVDMTAPTG
jgi:FkbM family methyltransferase